MNQRTRKIVSELKKDISSKYPIEDFKVFGSTASGTRRKGSDIDVFVLLPHLDRHIEEDLFDIAYDIELKFDCLIDLIAFGTDSVKGDFPLPPVYARALEEGISV
jgi:predicted nucleotidyltransferase